MSQGEHAATDAESARLRDPGVAPMLTLPAFERARAEALASVGDIEGALRAGQALFELGRLHARAHAGDDRPLYWNRLAACSALAAQLPAETVRAFEYAARGVPLTVPAEDWVHVTGFDPFRFERGVGIANPSGAAALLLHDERVQVGARAYRVRCAIFPVRFADFDAGVVERAARPALRGPRPASLVLTVSQNNRPGFALERWAGAFRTCAAHDNRGHYGDPATPTEARSDKYDLRARADEPTHLRSGLPIPAMLAADHIPGLHEATEHDDTSGSGGSYLSNEIFYRMLRLERATRPERDMVIPVGHLHVPLLASAEELGGERALAAERSAIARGVLTLLHAALAAL